MALAGVGGHSVAMARANLSLPEVRQWSAYLKTQGPMSVVRALERLEDHFDIWVARLIWGMFASQGNTKVKPKDFMPVDAPAEPEGPASIDDVMKLLSRVKDPRNIRPRKKKRAP